MNRRVDLVGALVVVLLGVTVFALSYMQQKATVRFDAIGPMGFPRVLGGLFVVLGSLQALRTVRGLKSYGQWAPHEGTEDEPEHASSSVRGLAFILGSFAYLALMPVLGYLVATPLAIASGLRALEFRRTTAAIAISVGFTLVGFYIFGVVLSVPLPPGIFIDLLVRV